VRSPCRCGRRSIRIANRKKGAQYTLRALVVQAGEARSRGVTQRDGGVESTRQKCLFDRLLPSLCDRPDPVYGFRMDSGVFINVMLSPRRL
jgi:hypothetical protein